VGNFSFQGKYLISADIVCETGLHIGGTEEGFEIGGLSNPVIRDPITEYPYVPGSSLKGKLRSLVEWSIPHQHNSGDNKTCVQYMLDKAIAERLEKKPVAPETETLEVGPCDCGKCDVCAVFGCSAETGESIGPTRLTIRDAMPKSETIVEWEKTFEGGVYTEIKTENSIGRISSAANPRPMERVPSGSKFRIDMVFDLYQECDKNRLKMVFQALQLLEDSSLGGSGTRGSGEVKFENIVIVKRGVEYYMGTDIEKPIRLNDNKTPFKIMENFSSIDWTGDKKC